MTASKMGELNAEILQNLGVIAENETVLTRVAKYLRRVVREMTNDPTSISKDEFYSSLDRGEKEYRDGKTHRIESVAELHSFLNSL